MPSRIAWIAGVVAAQGLLFVASLWWEGLGAPGWHHLASLVVAVLLLAPFRRKLGASRIFLGLGVLVTTALAVGSGFFILYWKVWLKAHALVDWIKFWHVFWSWLGIIFFLFHTWINRVALRHFWNLVNRNAGAASLVYGGTLLVLALSAWTWTPWGKDDIGDSNYILLTWYAWLVLVAPNYGAWWAAVVGRSWQPLRWVTDALSKVRVRGFVDVALVPATVLANVSGFPITFWKDEVHSNGFKFAGKFTHTLPSVVMAVLIFIHVVHLWRPTAHYWRLWGRPARSLRTAPSE